MFFLEKNGVRYFKAKEVFKSLGLTWRNTKTSLRGRGIDDSNIRRGDYLLNLTDKNIKSQDCVYINDFAFSRLLVINTKLSKGEVEKIVNENNLNPFVYSERIEISLLSIIEKIISNYNTNIKYTFIRQFCVQDYRIDLYIPELQLAIEIDESHHNKKEDDLRESDIRSLIKGIIFFRITNNNYIDKIGELVKCLGFDNDICELDSNYIND